MKPSNLCFIILVSLIGLLLASCTPSVAGSYPNFMTEANNVADNNSSTNTPAPRQTGVSTENQFTPQQEDENFTRAPAYVEFAEWDPSTNILLIRGSLPTACHELRIDFPDFTDQKDNMVNVYSVFDSEKSCADMLEPFEISLKIENDRFSNYSTIIVNDMESVLLGSNSAIQPSPPNENISNPYAPQTGDDELLHAPAYVNLAEWSPSDKKMHLQGNLPTSCHFLRISISESPNVSNTVMVDVYSVTSPDEVCANAMAPFDIYVALVDTSKTMEKLIVNGVEIYP